MTERPCTHLVQSAELAWVRHGGAAHRQTADLVERWGVIDGTFTRFTRTTMESVMTIFLNSRSNPPRRDRRWSLAAAAHVRTGPTRIQRHVSDADAAQFRRAWPADGRIRPQGCDVAAGRGAGSWASIFGVNLTNTTRSWTASDFNDPSLPDALNGVSIGEVLTCITKYAAGLFYDQRGRDRPCGGQDASCAALTETHPCRPGDTIVFYATGLEPTASGSTVGKPREVQNVEVRIGRQAGDVQFADLVAPGLFQVTVTVPAGARATPAGLHRF